MPQLSSEAEEPNLLSWTTFSESFKAPVIKNLETWQTYGREDQTLEQFAWYSSFEVLDFEKKLVKLEELFLSSPAEIRKDTLFFRIFQYIFIIKIEGNQNNFE